jgi:hypothetical protein
LRQFLVKPYIYQDRLGTILRKLKRTAFNFSQGNEEEILTRIRTKYNVHSRDGSSRPTALEGAFQLSSLEPEPEPELEPEPWMRDSTAESIALLQAKGFVVNAPPTVMVHVDTKEMEQQRARENPRYIDSMLVEACMQCECQFGVFTWQHQCRYCGWVVCHNCSSKTLELNRWVPVHGRSPLTPVDKLREQEPPVAKRVCDSCYAHAPAEMERRRENKRRREEQAALEAKSEDAREKQEVNALQKKLLAMKLKQVSDQQSLSELEAAAAEQQKKEARQKAEKAAAEAEIQRALALQQRAEREAAFQKAEAAQQERDAALHNRSEAEARLQGERDAKAAIEEEEKARQMEALRLSAEAKHLQQMALTEAVRQEVARQAAEAAAADAELQRIAADQQRAEMEAAYQKAQAAQLEQETAEHDRLEAEAKLQSERAAKAALEQAQAATEHEQQRLQSEQEHLKQLRATLAERKLVAKEKASVAAQEVATLRILAQEQSDAAEAARQKALAAQHDLHTAEEEAREAQHKQHAAKAKAVALEQEESATKTLVENEARERRIARDAAQAAAETRAKMKHLESAAQSGIEWEWSCDLLDGQWTAFSDRDARALSEQYVALQLRSLLTNPDEEKDTKSASHKGEGGSIEVVHVSGWVDLTSHTHTFVLQPNTIVAVSPGLDEYVPVGRWGRTTLAPDAKLDGSDPIEITWDDDGSTELKSVFSSLQECFFMRCPRLVRGDTFQLLDEVVVQRGYSKASGIVIGAVVEDDGSERIRVLLDASFAGEVEVRPEELVSLNPAKTCSIRGFKAQGGIVSAEGSPGLMNKMLLPPLQGTLSQECRTCDNCARVFGVLQGVLCGSANGDDAAPDGPLTMASIRIGMAVCRINDVTSRGHVVERPTGHVFQPTGSEDKRRVRVEFDECVAMPSIKEWVSCMELRAAPEDGHFICDTCFGAYVEELLETAEVCIPIKCPRCDKAVASDEVDALKHLSEDTSKALFEFLQTAAREEAETSSSVETVVTWECDVDGTFFPYDESITTVIEKAYQAGYAGCSFEHRSHKYVANLRDHAAPKQVNQATNVARAMRRVEERASEFETPERWTGLPQSENCVLVEVDRSSTEFTKLNGHFLETMGAKKAQILRVQRVQNKSLWDYYCLRRERMRKVNRQPPAEVSVWHGTGNPRNASLGTKGGTDPLHIYADKQ